MAARAYLIPSLLAIATSQQISLIYFLLGPTMSQHS